MLNQRDQVLYARGARRPSTRPQIDGVLYDIDPPPRTFTAFGWKLMLAIAFTSFGGVIVLVSLARNS